MVSIKDVAKLSGVSVMTVSRVVNGSDNVREETRDKVKQAIQELDYIPNQLAKSLVNSSTRTVGVLFSNIFNPVYLSIISGIEKRAHERGYNIIISNATDYKSSVEGLNMLVSKMIDGLIVLPVEFNNMNDEQASADAVDEMWRFYGALKRMLARRKLPCVVIDIDIKSDLADYVCHDYIGTAKMGIEYLIGLGFKRIHHINSELREGLWADRQKAYETGMKAAGLEKEIRVDYCANSTAAAFRLVRKLLQTNEKPEAFYCANDILAIGAMQAINACGLHIPDDIAVMGNDGIYIGEMLIPSLATVDICSSELGEKAMDGCHNYIEGNRASEKIYIRPLLRRGRSVPDTAQGKEI